MKLPTLENVEQAYQLIRSHITRTPIMTSTTINRIAGAQFFFKCENFQKAGAFKFRGACHAVFRLPDAAREKGVATHSSGNHAAALSLAASLRGFPAYIVMPENAPRVKIAAVRTYGGQIRFCQPTLQAREETLKAVVEQTGAIFIHPYNHVDVVAGQGTVALEMLEDLPDLDILVAPVGGGGLMSGIAIAAAALRPGIKLFGAEPQAADDAYRSLKSGTIVPPENPNTIADGLRTALSPLTFEILKRQQVEIITASEEAIVKAMRLIWERMKIVVEPSAAVPLAAILEHASSFRNRKVGVVLSGGNVDLDALPWIK